jgi:hypothetical protein
MMEDLEMNKNEFEVVKKTFGTKDMYLEATQALKTGQRKFVGSDGISYQIPEFMKSPEPATKSLKVSESVPWYRDSEGSAINLDNYVEPKEAAKMSEESEDLVYEDQVSNEALMDSLRRRHGDKSNEDLLELWAGEQHFINYNMAALSYDAVTLDSMTRQEKIDYLLQMETWDRVKGFGDGSQGFWDQLMEIGGALATDPSTYVGIGTLGVGLLAKAGSKTATKTALVSFLKESTKVAIKTGAKIGAAEGLAYGTADSILRQGIEQKATEKIDTLKDMEIDPVRTGVDAAVGTVGGVILGGGLAGAGKGLSNSFKAGEKARKGLDELIDDGDTPEIIDAEVVTPENAEVPPVVTKDSEVGQRKGAIQNVVLEYSELSPNQRKGRPHYKKTPITFENDLQRALFLAGSKKKGSKHYEAYVKFAMDALGKSREDVQKIGQALHAQIGEKLAERTGDKTAPLLTDFSYFKMGKKGELVGEVLEEVTPEGKQYPPMKTTAEQEQLAQTMSKVEGEDLPTHPKDGAPINLERTQAFDIDTTQAIIKNYQQTPGIVLNKNTEAAARKRLMSFKSMEDVQKFLETYQGKIEGLEVDATVVRMLFSSESNKIAKAWGTAKTKAERMNVLANNPQLLLSLRAITIMVQRSAASAGRVLQAHKINVNEFNEVLGRIVDGADTIRRVTDEAKVKGLDAEGEIKAAFSDKDMDALMSEMENLLAITADHNDHVRRALPAFKRTEPIWRKAERILTEVWLASNLSSLATQTGALAGSMIKRSTMKGESYLTWMVGKTFNMEDRLRWNELKAMNESNWAETSTTFRMMLRMMKGGTGEGAEGIMQREALDGWNTKWDDETTHGAINSDYLGFQDPNTLVKSFINKTLDVTGNVIRSPFTALTLADDMMKRVYYLPRMKYLLTKEANQKFPNNPLEHETHINEGIAAYEIFYMKKGMRTNTMKRHVQGEMEKFHKDKPDAGYDEIQAAELKATEEAEQLVQFTAEEQKLLDKVGIDDVKHEQALEHLREMLFQTDIPVDNTTVMGKALGTVKKTRDVTPILQTQLPYLKTVLNMSKDTLQRLPGIGLLSRDMRADIMAGGQKRAEAVSKMVMGTSLIGIGYSLSNNGLITATTEIEDYQVDSAAGIQGASLRIPGTDIFIPLNRIEPIGSFLLFAANGEKMRAEVSRLRDIVDAMPEGDVRPEDKNTIANFIGDYSLIMGSLAGKLFTEKSGATSVKKLLNVLQNPESDASQQWINQYTTGFIPLHAGIKQFNEGDVNFEAKGWFEHMRKKLGIMSKEYGDRDTIDLLGGINNDIKRLGGLHWRTSKPKRGDYVLAKLYELQPGLQRADNVIQLDNGIVKELSYKEVYELRTFMSHPKINVRARLFKAMSSPGFDELPDGVPGESAGYGKYTKIQKIREVYNQAKADAQDLYELKYADKILKESKAGLLKSAISVNTEGSKQRAKVMEDFTGR